MGNFRAIWNHEKAQSSIIARRLLEPGRANSIWRAFLPPSRLLDYLRFRKDLILTRKNFLFTKRLAFSAVKAISKGGNRASEIRLIEIKTRDILDKEKKGFYTEKVRRKQLHEIELLIDHYLQLLKSNTGSYAQMLRKTYPSKKKYLAFLDELQRREQEVTQAAVTSMRKGSKKDRLNWFNRVRETTRKIRMEELEAVFQE